MTCNSGDVITTEKLITFNKDIVTTNEFVTSDNDYTPPASDDEEKLTLTGIVNKANDDVNKAIENTVGKSYIGSWVSGVTTFTTMNEYSDYNGVTYKPKSGISLPYVAQGADPTIAPDNSFVEPFSDINSSNLANYSSYTFLTIDDIDNSITNKGGMYSVRVSDLVSAEDYSTGNNSGRLFFRVVTAGTGIHDGGKYIDLPTLGLQLVQNLPKTINAKCFGLKGNYTDDDKPQLVKLWDYAPWGSKIFYPAGQYKIDGGHTHPLKQLYHHGVGETPSFVPDGTLRGGTSFFFPTYTAINKGGIYMPPPIGLDFCRFSSFNDMTFFGNGTDDNTGNVTCLKINNLGTNLCNFSTRYGAVGAECNYSVGAHWKNAVLTASTYGAYFVYDVATPFGSELNSVATQNKFDNIVCNTSRTKTNAIGWYVDATCAYGGNNHCVWDMESCYTGATFEGRVALKDHDGLSVFGAASWQSSGNTFISAWFERNVGNNLVLSYDPGQQEPALSFDCIYEDVTKTTSAGDANSLIKRPNSIVPLYLGVGDESQGYIGQLSNPFTAGQFLIHGPEITTPHKRSLIDSRLPHQASNRPTFNTNSSFEFDVFIPNMPLLASTVNIANITLGNNIQSSTIEVTQVGTASGGAHYATFGKYLVENNNDAINSVIIKEEGSGGTVPFHLQSVRTGINTYGIFVYKDAALTAVTNATLSLKVVIGGSSGGGNQANLSILI